MRWRDTRLTRRVVLNVSSRWNKFALFPRRWKAGETRTVNYSFHRPLIPRSSAAVVYSRKCQPNPSAPRSNPRQIPRLLAPILLPLQVCNPQQIPVLLMPLLPHPLRIHSATAEERRGVALMTEEKVHRGGGGTDRRQQHNSKNQTSWIVWVASWVEFCLLFRALVYPAY
jgi:hypothetical protein